MKSYNEIEYWLNRKVWDIPAYIRFEDGPGYIFLLQAVHILGEHIDSAEWPRITQIYRNPALVLNENQEPEYSEALHTLLSRCSRTYIPEKDDNSKHPFKFTDDDKFLAASIKRHLPPVIETHARFHRSILDIMTQALASGALKSFMVNKNVVFGESPFLQWIFNAEDKIPYRVNLSGSPINEAIFPKAPDWNFEDLTVDDNYLNMSLAPISVWNGFQERTDKRFVFGEIDLNATNELRGPHRLYVQEDSFTKWLERAVINFRSEVGSSKAGDSIGDFIVGELTRLGEERWPLEEAVRQVQALLKVQNHEIAREAITAVAQTNRDKLKNFWQGGKRNFEPSEKSKGIAKNLFDTSLKK